MKTVNRLTNRVLIVAMLATSHASLALNMDYVGLEELFGEPVTAIATGKPLRVSESPLPVAIISHKEIAESGAMDIPQLLRRVAGVDVSRNFKGQADVNIRGYNQPLSNRLLVLVDGRQVYMDSLGFTMWNALPIQMNEIKQIEIVKGPNTSLLGFNAASGVVNIITFDPVRSDVDTVELRAGTQNHQEGSAVLTFSPRDDIAIRLSGGSTTTDGHNRDIYSVEISEEDALEKSNANLNVAYAISNNLKVQAEAGHSEQVADTMFAAGGNGIFDLETQHARIASTLDTKLFGLISANVYQNKSEFNVDFRKFNSTLNPTAPIENVLNVVQLSALKPLFKHHNVRLGLEYRKNTLEGAAIGTGAARFNNETYAVNAMWNWDISDQLHWTNALRQDSWQTKRDGGTALTDTKLNIQPDDYERNESNISYNSSLVYQSNPQTSYLVSVAKGLHIPSLAELSRSYVPAPVLENYGNPMLKAEENVTVNLGFTYRWLDEAAQLNLNVFQQKLKNIIGQTVTPPGPDNARADITFENLGESDSVGFEVMLTGKAVQNLTWNLNYSYIELTDKNSGDAVRDILHEENTPSHKLNALSTYRWNRWTFTSDIHYVHDIEYQSTVINFAEPIVTEKLRSYTILNLTAGFQLYDHTNLSVQGFNLIDDHQERPSFSVGSSVAGGEELGKTLLFTLRYQP